MWLNYVIDITGIIIIVIVINLAIMEKWRVGDEEDQDNYDILDHRDNHDTFDL